jgi:hypothetical protein
MEGENLFPTPTKHKLGQVDVWTVHKKVDGSKYKLLYLYSFGIVVCPLLGKWGSGPSYRGKSHGAPRSLPTIFEPINEG